MGGCSIILGTLLALAEPAAADPLPPPEPGLAPLQPAAADANPLPPREPGLAPAEGEAEGLPLPSPPFPQSEDEGEVRWALPPPPHGWVDVSHEALARGVFGVVDWFDRFFTDDRRLEVGRSESFLKVEGGLRLSTNGMVTPGYGIRLSATLPRLTTWLHRVRLVVIGVTPKIQAAATAALVDPGSAPRAPGQTSPQASAELRYDLARARWTVVDIGAGLLFGWPPRVYGRLRLTYMEHLWDGALARLTPAGFWVAGETGFGTTTQVDLEQQIGLADRLRVSTAIGVTQATAGWEGGMELAYYHAFTPTSAISFSGTWLGATKPYPYAKAYRLAVRLRRGFWKTWLFFEVEPEVTWQKEPGFPLRREEALILRLEVHFDSTHVSL